MPVILAFFNTRDLYLHATGSNW